MSRTVVGALALVAALLLAGCGQKRNLVLPDAPPPLDAPQPAPETSRD